MSARSFSQRPMVGPVSFSLSKFSFATVSGESVRPIPWTHISDKGHLFAIFENVTVQSYNGEFAEKSQFKVLADHEVMEDLDLRSLGREAMKAAQDMKRLPVPSKFPTVTVIIQEPCIAVRFPLQYGQIRRFQMKFKLASDFYKALSLFSQAECPFTQAGPTASQGKAPGLLNASPTVPPFGTGYLARDSLRSAPSMDSDRRTFVSSLGTSMYSSSRPSTVASSTWKSEKGVQPYSTQACASMDLACSAVPLVSPFFSEADRPPVIFNPVMEEHDTCRAIEHSSQQDHFLPSSSDPLTGIASTAVNRRHGPWQTTSVSEAPRPSTAPNLDSQSLSQMLPPKRELPFKVSKTTSDTTRRVLRSRQGPADALVNSSDNPIGGTLGSVTQASEHTNKVTPALPTKLAVKRPSKATRVTRKSVAGSRSRNKASGLDKDSPVPSVEELLRRSRELLVKQGSTSAEGKDADEGFGTVIAPEVAQVGVDLNNEVRGEAHATEGGRLQQTEKRLTTNQCQHQQHIKRKDFTQKDGESTPLHPSKRAALDAPLARAALNPLGDNGQKPIVGSSEAAIEIVAPRLEDSSTNANTMDANHSDGRRESQENCQSTQKPFEEIAAPRIDFGRIGLRERESVADTSDITPPDRSDNFASRSMRALMSDPAFAKSPEMADWTELTPEERDAALEMWMCEQLESDSFAALLKTLEGMWQRVFFGQ